MKKLIILTVLLSLMFSINAQWYSNQYSVTNMNELTHEQLDLSMDQALKLKKAGMITTGISTVVAIAGTIIYSKGLNNIVAADSYAGIDAGVNKSMNGYGVMTVGYVGVCVGIPLWIIGVQRTNNINIHLVKFEPMGFNSPQRGVGLSFSF